jgi:hypothetical protein
VTATWVVFGLYGPPKFQAFRRKAVEKLRQERRHVPNHGDADDSFHEMLPYIKYWIEHVMRACRQSDPATKHVLKLIEDHMLQEDPKDRWPFDSICTEFQSIMATTLKATEDLKYPKTQSDVLSIFWAIEKEACPIGTPGKTEIENSFAASTFQTPGQNSRRTSANPPRASEYHLSRLFKSEKLKPLARTPGRQEILEATLKKEGSARFDIQETNDSAQIAEQSSTWDTQARRGRSPGPPSAPRTSRDTGEQIMRPPSGSNLRSRQRSLSIARSTSLNLNAVPEEATKGDERGTQKNTTKYDTPHDTSRDFEVQSSPRESRETTRELPTVAPYDPAAQGALGESLIKQIRELKLAGSHKGPLEPLQAASHAPPGYKYEEPRSLKINVVPPTDTSPPAADGRPSRNGKEVDDNAVSMAIPHFGPVEVEDEAARARNPDTSSLTYKQAWTSMAEPLERSTNLKQPTNDVEVTPEKQKPLDEDLSYGGCNDVGGDDDVSTIPCASISEVPELDIGPSLEYGSGSNTGSNTYSTSDPASIFQIRKQLDSVELKGWEKFKANVIKKPKKDALYKDFLFDRDIVRLPPKLITTIADDLSGFRH